MKLYTRTVCPKCMLVKSALNGQGIEYEVLNVDENEEALEVIKAQNFSSVPILEIEGTFESDVSKMLKLINEQV